MKLAALFILPQLNFVLFSVSVLVGALTDELLSCWELRSLGTRFCSGVQSSFVSGLVGSLSELFCCCCCFKMVLRSPCMIAESRIIFWKQVLNRLPLPSLTGYGALQNGKSRSRVCKGKIKRNSTQGQMGK